MYGNLSGRVGVGVGVICILCFLHTLFLIVFLISLWIDSFSV